MRGPSSGGNGLGSSHGSSGDDGHVDELSQHRVQQIPQGHRTGVLLTLCKLFLLHGFMHVL